MNIVGSDLGKVTIRRGDWLVSEIQNEISERLHAKVFPLKGSTLKDGESVHFHLGASDITGRLFLCDQNRSARERAAFLTMDRAFHSVKGDRFVLRDQAAEKTIGGGIVCDPLPDRNLSRKRRFNLINLMQDPDPQKAFSELLLKGPLGLDLDRFRRICNLTTSALNEIIETTDALSLKIDTNSWVVAKSRWTQAGCKIVEIIKGFHKSNPDFSGITLEKLYVAVRESEMSLGQKILTELLTELVSDGLVQASGGMYKLTSFSTVLSKNLEKMWPEILKMLSLPVNKIPVVQDLSEAIRVPKVVLEKCLKEAVGIKYLVRVSEKRYFLPETVDSLRKECVSIATNSSDGRFTVRDFRDKTGIGRNAVVEILEFFDREQLTLRQGNHRVLRR